jgi:hypothetical protein
MNNILDIEESDERCLHCDFEVEALLGGGNVGSYHWKLLSFAFGIILKGPCFIPFLISHKI